MVVERSRFYVIEQTPGYTADIGRLVSMLTYVRYSTLKCVKGLTTEQLDCIPAGFSNSIGALLQHIASVETYYYIKSIEQRDMTMEETMEWRVALELGDEARAKIRGYPLDQYMTLLEQIRNRTLDGLKQKSDVWLHHLETIDDGTATNNYWRWFHVLEDELNHRGQIRLIRNNLAIC